MPLAPRDHVADFRNANGVPSQRRKPSSRRPNARRDYFEKRGVIRGVVLQKDNSPLSGVRVSIEGFRVRLHHSRGDGQYDLAVAGGRVLYVDYMAAGYLPAQRQVAIEQQSFAQAQNVVTVIADPVATPITMGATPPMQVANSSTQSDSAGSRAPTMYFQPGTSAQLLHADGTTEPATSLTVRATEYTVGPNGVASMPAELPGTSAYTYCVDLTADEATSALAKGVLFDHEVAVYVDNYLNLPVGAIVPSGYHDPVKKAWVPLITASS